jgi:flagellar capping protein FliD
MGRPLSKRFFSNPTNTGKQITLTKAFIPGAASSTNNAWIVAQKGVNKYIVTDGTHTGLVRLTDGSAATAGEAYIDVAVFGGGTEHAKQINAHTVKTHAGHVYRWSTSAASKAGEADIPLV